MNLMIRIGFGDIFFLNSATRRVHIVGFHTGSYVYLEKNKVLR